MPRRPAFRAERIKVGTARRLVASEFQEPVVELAEVAEHERADVAEVVDEVPLAPPDVVVQVVVAAGARAARREPMGAWRAGGTVGVVELPAVLFFYGRRLRTCRRTCAALGIKPESNRSKTR